MFAVGRLLPFVPCDVVRESEHVLKVQVFWDDGRKIWDAVVRCNVSRALSPRPTFHRTERVLVERLFAASISHQTTLGAS